MNDITVIVPVDLSQRPIDILSKAVRISEAAEKSRIPVIFSLNDQGTRHDIRFKKIIQKYATVTVVAANYYSGAVNPSLLRNRAVDTVSTEFITLLDVDIWPDFSIIAKYKCDIAQKKWPFYFLPCMYLTARGTNDLCKGRITPEILKEKYFAFSRKEFLHLANPSSITIMRTQDYEEIGGFDESYSGHGYEDFDFMMRLAKRHGMLRPCKDMMTNKSARSPLFTSGFRRALGRLSIDALLEKDFVFHLYHDRPSAASYNEHRKTNYSRFTETHNDDWGDATSKSLMEEFIEACRLSRKSFEDYSAFFENKPGHIDRFDTFKRRLRFLLK